MSLFVEDVVFSVHCLSAATHEIVAPEDRLEELLRVGWKPNSKGILKHWSCPIQAMPHEFGEVHFDPRSISSLVLKMSLKGTFCAWKYGVVSTNLRKRLGLAFIEEMNLPER